MFEQVIMPGGDRGQLGKGLLASVGLHGALLGVVLLIAPGKPAAHSEPTLLFIPRRALAASTAKAQPAAKAVATTRHRRHRPKLGKRILPTERAVEETEVDLSDDLPEAAGPADETSTVIGAQGTPGVGGPSGVGQIVDFDALGAMTAPRLLEGSAPGYTADALRAGVEGTVIARCVLTAQGLVEHCRILRGLPFLDPSVLGALGAQRYAPVTFEGHPVSVNYVFTFRFVLPR